MGALSATLFLLRSGLGGCIIIRLIKKIWQALEDHVRESQKYEGSYRPLWDNARRHWKLTAIGSILLVAILGGLVLVERAGYWPSSLTSKVGIEKFVVDKILRTTGMCGFSFDAMNAVLSEHYDEAISLYTEHLEGPGLDAETTACLFRERALAYRMAKRDSEAERDYSAAVDLLPDDPDVYRVRPVLVLLSPLGLACECSG